MSDNVETARAGAAASPWSPLQDKLFRGLWIATIVSNVGTWMQDVGAGWLMTSLSSSPAMVALVEAADSIPVMLLAMPAGALADIIDRRRLLIAVQTYLMLVAGALAIITLLELTTPWVLLGFIFALGVGTAMVMPAWAAIVPDLVRPDELQSAVALNSIAINVSRAIGPAVAGVLVAAVGPWLVFMLNALSYIGIIAVLVRWRHEHRRSTLPAERFLSAIRIGARFVTHTRALQAVLVRGAAFFVFASATWSLFPLIVRRELQRGPEIYGLLLTCIGIGAVGGAMRAAAAARELLARHAGRGLKHAVCAGGTRARARAERGASCRSDARHRRRVDLDPFRAAGFRTDDAAALGARARPRRIRRHLHGRHGARQHLLGSGRDTDRHPRRAYRGGGGNGRCHCAHVEIQAGHHQVLDFTPTMDLPLPVLAETPEPDVPVMVTIEYRIRPDRRTEFVAAMQAVREMRRRNGAYFWQLVHDVENPTLFVEVFMDESWLEHLRQHERASVADRQILNRAKAFLVEGASTKSSHWVGDREQ